MILLSELFDTEEKQQTVMRKCELEIYQKLNLSIKLKVKDFDEPVSDELLNFDIPEVGEVVEEELELVGNSKKMSQFFDELFKVGGINTRLGIAELVNKLYPKHFIYHEKEWFGWNASKNKWEKSVIPLRLCIIYNIRDYLTKELEEFKKNRDEFKGAVHDKFILLEGYIQDIIVKFLCNPLEIDCIVKSALDIMVDNDLEFDANRNLFGCKNGVYDIEIDKFRPYRFDDFVTMSCGFDFEDIRTKPGTEEDSRKYEDIHRILKQVFPNEEVRKLVMLIFSSGISGKCIEKFFVFNGEGGNGKGLLDEFMKSCLGDYYYEADITLLTQKKIGGGGANQELADIDKKRYLLFKEPGQFDGIENSNVKDMTGGGNIKARGLYQTKTYVELHNTTVMECNKKPNLKEQPTKGDIRRIVDILFGSTFTPNEEDKNEKEHVYEADPLLKEDKWKVEHRVYFLNMLFSALQELKQENYNIDKFIPNCVKDRSNKYLLGCCDVHQLFTDCYKQGDDNAVLSLKDIALKLRTSQSFYSLPKKKQSSMKNDVIYDFFKTNTEYKKYYKERHDYTVDGVRKFLRNVMIGWVEKKIESNNDDDE
jgi:phage/plasmid-associated DNA primase